MNPLLQQIVDPTLYSGGTEGAALAGIMAIFAAFFLVFMVVFLAVYIYMALALMKTAKRLNVEPAWLAWIPIGNVYLMLKMGKQPWWPMLLLIAMIIPIVNIVAMIVFVVFVIMAQYKICEARQRPGWWAILSIVPFVGGIWSLIMWGILAWGK